MAPAQPFGGGVEALDLVVGDPRHPGRRRPAALDLDQHQRPPAPADEVDLRRRRDEPVRRGCDARAARAATPRAARRGLGGRCGTRRRRPDREQLELRARRERAAMQPRTARAPAARRCAPACRSPRALEAVQRVRQAERGISRSRMTFATIDAAAMAARFSSPSMIGVCSRAAPAAGSRRRGAASRRAPPGCRARGPAPPGWPGGRRRRRPRAPAPRRPSRGGPPQHVPAAAPRGSAVQRLESSRCVSALAARARQRVGLEQHARRRTAGPRAPPPASSAPATKGRRGRGRAAAGLPRSGGPAWPGGAGRSRRRADRSCRTGRTARRGRADRPSSAPPKRSAATASRRLRPSMSPFGTGPNSRESPRTGRLSPSTKNVPVGTSTGPNAIVRPAGTATRPGTRSRRVRASTGSTMSGAWCRRTARPPWRRSTRPAGR